MRRELKVGDRVRYDNLTGIIKRIEGIKTWTKWDQFDHICQDLDLSPLFIIIEPAEPKIIKQYGIVKFMQETTK